MQKTLSAFELGVLIKEWNEEMKDSRVDQIYIRPPKDLLLQVHRPNKGKIMLRINAPTYSYLTQTKPEMPQIPHGFCMFLRKRLDGARVRSIEQMDFERIFMILFETKEATYKLYVEMFSKGNIILCDEKNMILSAFEVQEWSTRIVKPKEVYTYPNRKCNFWKMDEDEFKELIQTSTKDSIVKALAMDLGLGGTYAEELCTRAHIAKEKKDADNNTIHRIFTQIEELRSLKNIKPMIIAGKDIVPIELASYKDAESENTPTYNEAFDKVFSHTKNEELRTKAKGIYHKEREKIERVLSEQKLQFEHLESEYEENTKKGELIYAKYQLVKEILDQLHLARKTMSWKEIKEKLKGHKIIKDIHEAKQEILVELDE